jgi:hypothetical protein
MNEKIERLLLEMVRDHSGSWGWYQIDRALGFERVAGVNVPQAMAELVERGLVQATGALQLAATTYALTDEGFAAVRGEKAT